MTGWFTPRIRTGEVVLGRARRKVKVIAGLTGAGVLVLVVLGLGGAPSARSAAARAPQLITCGVRVTRNAVLTHDLDCPTAGPGSVRGPAVTIVASGVTVDLGGYRIDGDFNTVISAEGVNHVTIRNGAIATEGSALLASGHGDRFVDLSASGDTGGIVLHDGGHNTVLRGDLGGGSPGRSYALRILREDGDRIIDVDDSKSLSLTASRYVRVLGSRFDFGVSVDPSSRHNILRFNQIGNGVIDAPSLDIRGDGNTFFGNAVFGPRNVTGDQDTSPVIAVSGRHNRLNGNRASNSAAGDGIDVLTPGNVLKGNIAINNAKYGINAVPGTIDAGANRAEGTPGTPRQCIGVRCIADTL